MAVPATTLDRSLTTYALTDVVRRLNEDERCLGVVVFGSFARGSMETSSDLDVLVLHGETVPEDVYDDLPSQVSIAFYSSPRLAALPERGPLFALHLAREGVVTKDETGELREVLKGVSGLDEDACALTWKRTLRRFADVKADVERPRADTRSLAAEAYAVAKQAAMLDLAVRGRCEFDRRRAFRSIADRHPALAPDVQRVEALETHWLTARNRRTSPDAISDLDIARPLAALERLLAQTSSP
jgi:predicted nucleotidyltransferase